MASPPDHLNTSDKKRHYRGWPSSLCARALSPCILAMLCLTACTRKHSFQVRDVTTTNKFNLVSRFGDLVSGISLHLTGSLQGSALAFVSGSPTQELSGAVDLRLYQHLQTSNCVFHYHPQGVTTGILRVDYFFR
jgi:hypothetical protein